MTRIDELYLTLSTDDRANLVLHLNKKQPLHILCGTGEFIGVHFPETPTLQITMRAHGWCCGKVI